MHALVGDGLRRFDAVLVVRLGGVPRKSASKGEAHEQGGDDGGNTHQIRDGNRDAIRLACSKV